MSEISSEDFKDMIGDSGNDLKDVQAPSQSKTNNPADQKKKNLIAGLIILGVAVIAVVAFVIYLLSPKTFTADSGYQITLTNQYDHLDEYTTAELEIGTDYVIVTLIETSITEFELDRGVDISTLTEEEIIKEEALFWGLGDVTVNETEGVKFYAYTKGEITYVSVVKYNDTTIFSTDFATFTEDHDDYFSDIIKFAKSIKIPA